MPPTKARGLLRRVRGHLGRPGTTRAGAAGRPRRGDARGTAGRGRELAPAEPATTRGGPYGHARHARHRGAPTCRSGRPWLSGVRGRRRSVSPGRSALQAGVPAAAGCPGAPPRPAGAVGGPRAPSTGWRRLGSPAVRPSGRCFGAPECPGVLSRLPMAVRVRGPRRCGRPGGPGGRSFEAAFPWRRMSRRAAPDCRGRQRFACSAVVGAGGVSAARAGPAFAARRSAAAAMTAAMIPRAVEVRPIGRMREWGGA